MKYFIKKVALFLMLPAIVLFILSAKIQTYIDEKVSQTSISSEYVEWNAITKGQINADLIVMGSSRAWVHFDPKKLDSAFNLNSFNLGMAAYSFDAQYSRLQTYLLKNSKPSTIIQTIDYNLLIQTKSLFGVNQFVPYFKFEPIKKFLKNTDELTFLDFNLPFYKYRWIKENGSCLLSSFINIYENSLNKGINKNLESKYKGFKAQNLLWGQATIEKEVKSKKFINSDIKYVDSSSYNNFIKYIAYCKANKINLVLVYPPEYYRIRENVVDYDLLLAYYKNLAYKNNLIYLDYTSDIMNKDSSFFYDFRHLNLKGVEYFNSKFLKDISELELPIK